MADDWRDVRVAAEDDSKEVRTPLHRKRSSSRKEEAEALTQADSLQLKATEMQIAAAGSTTTLGSTPSAEREQQVEAGGADAAAGGERPRVQVAAAKEAAGPSSDATAEEARLQRLITPPLPPRRSGSSRGRRISEGDGSGMPKAVTQRNSTSPSGASADRGIVVPVPSQAVILPQPRSAAAQRGVSVNAVAGRGPGPRPPPKASRTSFDRYEIHLNQPRWQQWQGNNKFCCNGRIMLGVHYRQLYVTCALLFVTWAVFFVFIFPAWGSPIYAIVGVALIVLTVISLAYASFLDPGIIPRRPPNQVVENMPPEVKERMNYCVTCHIVRPPRAKHCRHCNNCVASFDHHCPWTGNCVGRRNYRSFFVFILLVVLSAAYIFCLTTVSLITLLGDAGPTDATDSNGGVPGGRYLTPFLAMWALIVLTLVGSLLGFHTYLLMRGQTTNEYLRGEKRRGNVPHKSFWGNCWDLWTLPAPPSLLPDMRDYPTQEEHKKDVQYTLQAVAELQETMQGPPFGDIV